MSKSQILNELIRAAKMLEESYPRDAQRIIDLIHEIRAGSSPDSFFKADVMKDIASLMHACGIKWALIGAGAVVAYGQSSRFSEDFDILVDRLPDNMLLSNSEYMGRFNFYRGKSISGNHLVIDHKKMQVEMLPVHAEDNELRQWALDTSGKINIPALDGAYPVITPTALVAMKLRASFKNPSRVSKDYPDIMFVMNSVGIDKEELLSYIDEKELTAFYDWVDKGR